MRIRKSYLLYKIFSNRLNNWILDLYVFIWTTGIFFHHPNLYLPKQEESQKAFSSAIFRQFLVQSHFLDSIYIEFGAKKNNKWNRQMRISKERQILSGGCSHDECTVPYSELLEVFVILSSGALNSVIFQKLRHFKDRMEGDDENERNKKNKIPLWSYFEGCPVLTKGVCLLYVPFVIVFWQFPEAGCQCNDLPHNENQRLFVYLRKISFSWAEIRLDQTDQFYGWMKRKDWREPDSFRFLDVRILQNICNNICMIVWVICNYFEVLL